MRTGRWRAALCGALIAVCGAAAPAAAEPAAQVQDPRDAAEAARQAVGHAPESYEEYLAEELSAQPADGAVVVGGELGGSYDTAALEEQLHERFAPLGVDYQVVAADWRRVDLAVVADRVDRDALYVLLDHGWIEAHERGVSAGAEDAARAASEQVPTGDRRATALVDVFAAELDGGAAGADGAAPAAHGSEWTYLLPGPLRLDLSYEGDAERFGRVVGAVAGVAAVGAFLGFLRSRRTVLFCVLGAVPVALAAGGAVLVYKADTAQAEADAAVFAASEEDPVYRGLDPGYTEDPPYVPDTARLDAAAADLAASRIHVAPAAAGTLTADEAAGLAASAAEAGAFVVVSPVDPVNESGGDPELYLHALHAVHGQDGTYLVVRPDSGTARIDGEVFGSEYDSWEFRDVLWEIEASDAAAAASAGLDAAADIPGGYDTADPPTLPEPLEPDLDTDSTGAYALAVLGALVFGGAVAAAAAAAGSKLLGRNAPGAGENPLGGPAPRTPGRRALERMLDTELERLRTAVEEAPDKRRARAADALDAVLLLAAAEPDTDDLVGLVLLARRGVLAAGGDPAATAAVCSANPLHGAVHPAAGRKAAAKVCPACKDGTPSRLELSGDRGSLEFWTRYSYGTDISATAQAVRARLGVSR